jgi:hypothetical protein
MIRGKSCRNCNAPIHNRRSGLCAACHPKFCVTCKEPKEPGRTGKHCKACCKERNETAKRLPYCSRCLADLPEGWRSRWCSRCRSTYRNGPLYEQKRQADRKCYSEGCPNILPAGRWDQRCTTCVMKRKRQLASRSYRVAHGLPPVRLCPQCAEPIPDRYARPICRDCQSIYDREYKMLGG